MDKMPTKEEYEQHLLTTKNLQFKENVRGKIYKVADLDSLLGKTANFTAAIANIQLHMMGALLKAQSFEAFKTEMMVYAPFIQQLQSMIANGEIMSVQSAQGAKDTDAVIEGLTALTQVARVIKAAKE